jgi:alpha/beta superfamily hydrolase
MGQMAISFKSGDITLEGVAGYPETSAGPFPGVVICHPHPLGGGNMNNNLVVSVYDALLGMGFAALRFNFRGVGGSQGTHAGGEREPEDAEAALATLGRNQHVDRERLGMAGYSFGTGVILRNLSGYASARSFLLYSPPVRFLEYPGIGEDVRPKLFVCGDRDRSVPVGDLREKLESLPEAELRVVTGADHFWDGRESEAAGHAVEFFGRTLQPR